MTYCAGVAKFAGETVVAVNHLSVYHDTAADTCSESNHDEVLHASRSTVGHLTHGSRIGIIGKSYRNAVHPLFQELGNRNHTLVSPFEVYGVLDFTGIVVSVRNTHSDTADLSCNASIGNHLVDSFCKFINIRFHFIVSVGSDDRLGKNLTSHIHNAYLGGLSTDIDADNIRHIHFIHTYIIYYSTGISLFTFLQPTSA